MVPTSCCSYFKNYLLDVNRGAGLRTIELVEDYGEVERTCEGARDYTPPIDSEFLEYGISHQDVHSRARDFLGRLDDIGRVYLALHAAPMHRSRCTSWPSACAFPPITIAPISSASPARRGARFRLRSTQIGSWLAKELGWI